jgi:hypothetical protein
LLIGLADLLNVYLGVENGGGVPSDSCLSTANTIISPRDYHESKIHDKDNNKHTVQKQHRN